MNPITLFLVIACALASLQPLRLFPGLRLLPLSGSLRRLTDWGGGGAQHVVLMPQISPRSRLSSTRAISRLGRAST
jgi:hypothetical protein